jgi:hypothetical protein
MDELIFYHSNVCVQYLTKPFPHLSFVWKGTPEFEVYTEALTSSLTFLEKITCPLFLIDQRQLEFVGSKLQAWLSIHWFPKVDKLIGQELYLAILPSKKLYTQLASKVIAKSLQESGRQYTIYYFESEIVATDWLAECNKTEFKQNK